MAVHAAAAAGAAGNAVPAGGGVAALVAVGALTLAIKSEQQKSANGSGACRREGAAEVDSMGARLPQSAPAKSLRPLHRPPQGPARPSGYQRWRHQRLSGSGRWLRRRRAHHAAASCRGGCWAPAVRVS